MKRSVVGLLVVALAAVIGLPAAASAKGSDIAKSLGNVRWGMSESEVKAALKGKIKGSTSYVEFDGKKTRWDSSPIAEEYTHGNDEAMLTYTSEDGSENYYFFIGGELWKWVKLYPASAFGGRDYKGFAKKVQGRFGKGYEKEGEVNSGTGYRYKFLEFLDRNTRLRAVDKTERLGQYALVFESMETVRALAGLRTNTIRRATNPKANGMAKARASDDEEAEAPRAAKGKDKNAGRSSAQPAGFTLASAKKRSIFADEKQDDESQADYQARKQRIVEQERNKQRRQHERSQEEKKGKILDELAGVDDDDPISGMK